MNERPFDPNDQREKPLIDAVKANGFGDQDIADAIADAVELRDPRGYVEDLTDPMEPGGRISNPPRESLAPFEEDLLARIQSGEINHTESVDRLLAPRRRNGLRWPFEFRASKEVYFASDT